MSNVELQNQLELGEEVLEELEWELEQLLKVEGNASGGNAVGRGSGESDPELPLAAILSSSTTITSTTAKRLRTKTDDLFEDESDSELPVAAISSSSTTTMSTTAKRLRTIVDDMFGDDSSTDEDPPLRSLRGPGPMQYKGEKIDLPKYEGFASRDLVISPIAFKRIVQEIGQDFKMGLHFEPEALEALQQACEVLRLLQNVFLCFHK